MKFNDGCGMACVICLLFGIAFFDNATMISFWLLIFALMNACAYFGYEIRKLEMKR